MMHDLRIRMVRLSMAQERCLADIAVDGDRISAVGMLSHWTLDRRSDPKLNIEKAVEKQTRATARLYGLNDRGVLGLGMKARIDIIDYENIDSSLPKMVADLPAGGKRLLQTATGYRATIVSGVVTFENGVATGALPGRLLRSAPNAFTPVLAAA